MKSQLTGKDPDAGKDCRQEENGVAGDEMDDIRDSVDMSLSKLWVFEKDRKAWCAAVLSVSELDMTKGLNNEQQPGEWK